MKKNVKVIVLRSAGTNCDRETTHAFEMAGATVESVHINRLASGQKKLDNYHILAIAGGFSYGDDISAGKVLANELSNKLSDQVDKFVADGKLVIGICNGFQVLVKTGLLPGYGAGINKSGMTSQNVTVFDNDSGRFECRWVFLKLAENSKCVFTKDSPEIISLPIAHGEGKLIFDSAATKDKLWKNNQAVYQYVDEKGNPATYPANPNGSADSLAGICNATGRVFGLMPHPERNVLATHHPRWTRGDSPKIPHGTYIFKNAVSFAAAEL